eukprot:RCo049949
MPGVVPPEVSRCPGLCELSHSKRAEAFHECLCMFVESLKWSAFTEIYRASRGSLLNLEAVWRSEKIADAFDAMLTLEGYMTFRSSDETWRSWKRMAWHRAYRDLGTPQSWTRLALMLYHLESSINRAVFVSSWVDKRSAFCSKLDTITDVVEMGVFAIHLRSGLNIMTRHSNSRDMDSHVRDVVATVENLAQKCDEVSHKVGIAKVAGGSASVAGGSLFIAGILLTPFSGGASLALSLAG